MANTIAYTSSAAPTGSLKSGVISINLNDQIIGQNYNWRNGIVFSNQYIIYSDTYTQGIDTEANAKPCAWACDYNNGALLNLINTLPPRVGQTPYTTLSDAITWLQGQNKYFIVNQNYPTITTDGLTFLFDPGMTASYPVTNTTMYDISGSGNSGSLVNGPVYNNSGTTSYFAFDGTDDRIVVPNNASLNFGTGPFTIIVWVSSPYNLSANRITIQKGSGGGWSDGQGWKVTSGNAGGDLSWYWVVGNGTTHVEVPPASTFSKSNDTYPMGMFAIMRNSNNTIDRFWNGVYNQNFASLAGDVSSSSDLWIGDGYSENSIYGNIAKVLTYNKALSQSELLQNYYQGPIITTGLNTAIDFGNIISYPGTSTTAYDLTTRANNATLQNGITFNINEGGVVYLDGTDDFIQLSEYTSYAFGNTPTVAMWIKPMTAGTYGLLSHCSGGPVNLGYGLENGYMSYRNYDFQWNYYTSNAYVGGGSWTHVAWVKETSTSLKFYVNGVLQDTITITNTNGPINTIGSYWGPCDSGGFSMFNGWIGNVYLYSQTALSASQILQNYSAQRSRFETNQAFANGGTISTVVENGIRYRVHTFTSSGTLTVLSAGKMEVLCVAGGGGGGANHAGGGGGGGLIHNTDYSVTTGNKTVTVGGGGAKSSQFQTETGQNGNNSVFDNLTSIGGGGGGNRQDAGPANLQYGQSGGCGGGSGGQGENPTFGLWPGGNGTVGQGCNGGSATFHAGGGGGGAGGEGEPGSTINGADANTIPGDGGIGKSVSISGVATYYAGGGGGGGWIGGTYAGTGGLGGGGNGQKSTGQIVNGTTNTGGGGGGADGGGNANGGNGGSGIVIVRYRI
jgi:hypothetical protein